MFLKVAARVPDPILTTRLTVTITQEIAVSYFKKLQTSDAVFEFHLVKQHTDCYSNNVQAIPQLIEFPINDL